ncbi:MAG: hypothetical protein IIW31_08345, partial [Clostridia bacterium]|nr:hypothetical protein [Clostridia bacterium]
SRPSLRTVMLILVFIVLTNESLHRKKHLREQVLFSVKFVPAERVKYAGACEIACGSEIRLRRVKERILFHILQSRIFHNARWRIISHSSQGKYFTFILFFLESDPCNQAKRRLGGPTFST